MLAMTRRYATNFENMSKTVYKASLHVTLDDLQERIHILYTKYSTNIYAEYAAKSEPILGVVVMFAE